MFSMGLRGVSGWFLSLSLDHLSPLLIFLSLPPTRARARGHTKQKKMNEPDPSKRAKYISSSTSPKDKPRYSFCESVTATTSSPWHLRELDGQGPRYTGGITTSSLCGLVTRGWDLKVAITEHHLGHSCKRCVEKYREGTT